MTHTKKRNLLHVIIVSAIVLILILFAAITALGQLAGTSAEEESKAAVTKEVSTEAGNGPVEKITSLKEMGFTSIENRFTTNSNCGKIDNNKLIFTNDMSDAARYISGNKAYIWASYSTSSLKISMDHSWFMSMKTWSALDKHDSTTASASSIDYTLDSGAQTFTIQIFNDANGRRIKCGSQLTTISVDELGSEQNNAFSFNSVTNKIKLVFGSSTLEVDNPFPRGTAVQITLRGQTELKKSFSFPTTDEDKHKLNYIDFQSFEYTDYYLKAKNDYITDYAGRKISGAVGNGHTIGAYPTILNNSEASPANTQRFTGTVSGDTAASENITFTGPIASNPLSFAHDSSPSQELSLEARVDTDAPYSPGQKFKMSLGINDSYFGSSDLSGKTGVPDIWHNLKYDADNDGTREAQLPLKLQVIRDTNRELKSDTDTESGYDYSHFIGTKQTKPNSHGWFNQNVTIKFNTNPDEFNELNFSTAAEDEKITTSNIPFTAHSDGSGMDSFTVKGTSPEEETPEDGITYSVFARKGTSKTTESLSAVTRETFRIDRTAPTIKIADKAKPSDPRRLEAKDNLSGIDYIKWKGPDDNDYPTDDAHRIVIESDPNAVKSSKTPPSQKLPAFDKTGSYTFVAVDLAGNESEPLTVTNTEPTLKASDKKLSFQDTLSGFKPVTQLKAAAADYEDGDISSDRLLWKIERKGFDTVTGSGDTVPDSLIPVGSYKVTFWLDGNGGDSDNNKPDPDKVTVNLTITPGTPPIIKDDSDPSGDIIDGNLKTDPQDGTKHYYVEDEKIIIADPDNPYDKSKLYVDDVRAEIEAQFAFQSRLPAPANALEVIVILQDKNGNDISEDGYIDTTKAGTYTAVYRATDASGCSTTLELVYTIKANVNAVFHSGKGDYVNGDTERSVVVKVNQSPDSGEIPSESELTPPAQTCFIGWGTSINATTAVKPDDMELGKDTTFYAIYAKDINSNSIPDSEEAIFRFQSGDPENAAYKHTDKTMVGILVPDGSLITLTDGQLPELLFERKADTGYGLKGYKTDTTGDRLLSKEELCQLAKGPGTITKVTAMIESYPISNEGKVTVTFFSSDPSSAPLKGGEGQTVILNAENESEAVYLASEKLPDIELKDGSSFKGWKMEKTGDKLMSASEVAGQSLYGGETVALIAYVDTPPVITEKPVIEKVPSENTEKETVKVPVKVPEKITEKTSEKAAPKAEAIDLTIKFAFYTSDEKHGKIQDGDGTVVMIKAGSDGKGSLPMTRLPELNIADGSLLIGWNTSVTGDRLLTSEQLSEIKFASGSTINCTAIFGLKDIDIKGRSENASSPGSGLAGTDGQTLSSIPDTQVPLGAAPGHFKINQKCLTHWIMLFWICLTLITICWRLHVRKKSSRIYYSSANSEEVPDTRLYTGFSDYLFIAGDFIIGIVIAAAGSCSLELTAMIIGGIILLYYLVRMKILDRREKRRMADQSAV